jgi:hypothetical protein
MTDEQGGAPYREYDTHTTLRTTSGIPCQPGGADLSLSLSLSSRKTSFLRKVLPMSYKREGPPPTHAQAVT